MSRQALYACLSCTISDSSGETVLAGVCLACSYECHENHQLVELYTKRFFKCDCGNKLFGNNKCKLRPVRLMHADYFIICCLNSSCDLPSGC